MPALPYDAALALLLRLRGGGRLNVTQGANSMADATIHAVRAAEAPLRARASGYPADLAARVAGREKRPLGDLFGLGVFGVNLTRLAPGAWSALHHRHTRQDEFIYVLEGTPTLITDAGATPLSPGMCAGFPAGGRRTTWRTAAPPMW